MSDNEDDFEIDTDVDEPIAYNQKTGLARIEELVQAAQSSLAEARKIANDNHLSFVFSDSQLTRTYNGRWGEYEAEESHWEPSQIC